MLLIESVILTITLGVVDQRQVSGVKSTDKSCINKVTEYVILMPLSVIQFIYVN